jgi:hypothetical protein
VRLAATLLRSRQEAAMIKEVITTYQPSRKNISERDESELVKLRQERREKEARLKLMQK